MADTGEGDAKAGKVTFDSVHKAEDVVIKLFEGAYRELFMKTLAENEKPDNKTKLPEAPPAPAVNKEKELVNAAEKVLNPAIPLPDGWLIIPTTHGFVPNGIKVEKKF